MRVAAFAALAALLVAPSLHAQGAPALPRLMNAQSINALPQARPTAILRYGDHPSQLVELFLPAGERAPGRLPVVVMVHGGCWQSAVAGPGLLRAAAGALARKGLAVWSVGYRRVDEEGGGYPGTYADVAAAIELLLSEAEQRGLDPGNVVFFGHSAGAHLALWAASRHRLPKDSPLWSEDPLRPRGVVAFGGFGDLREDSGAIRAACRIDPAERLVNPLAADPFADTSPAALLPARVPVVMVHGVYDGVAYPRIGLAHAQAARAAGDQADVLLVPNAGHFEGLAPGQRAFEVVTAELERFTR